MTDIVGTLNPTLQLVGTLTIASSFSVDLDGGSPALRVAYPDEEE